MRQIYIVGIILIGFLFSGCGDNSPDLISIDEFIEQNNLEVEETASGLKYIIDNPGSAEKPNISSIVTVAYVGRRTDALIFDSHQGLRIGLSQVIPGWTEGIQLFGRGGSGTLLIPSPLGYGTRGFGPEIPPNADLIFDIEVLDF